MMKKNILILFSCLLTIFTVLPMHTKAGVANWQKYDDSFDELYVSRRGNDYTPTEYSVKFSTKSGRDYYIVSDLGNFNTKETYKREPEDFKFKEAEDTVAIDEKGDVYSLHMIQLSFNPPSVNPEIPLFNEEYELVPWTYCFFTTPEPKTKFELKCSGNHTIKVGETTSPQIKLFSHEYQGGNCPESTSEGVAPSKSELTWVSTDESVATVDNNGIISGEGKGEAVIVGKMPNGLATYFPITVEEEKSYVEIKKLSLSNDNLLQAGENFRLIATETVYRIEEGKELDLTADKPYAIRTKDGFPEGYLKWTSSDPTVATVDEYGVVEGKKEGSSIISVSSDSDTARVTVSVLGGKDEEKEIRVTGITLLAKDTALTEGESTKLFCGITPGNADNQEVIYSSSDETVAKVTENGTVTGLSAGEAVITAISKDNPDIKDTITIKVSPKENPKTEEKAPVLQKIVISGNAKTNINKSIQLKAVAYNSNNEATKDKIIWTSSNKKVATVNASGKVTPKNNGTTTVTASVGNVKATRKITVWKVSKIKISGKSKVKKGKKIKLKAKITCTNGGKSSAVTWKTSNKKIAKVNKKGEVTGVKKGKVKITAIAKDGKKVKATKTITVK